jgi:two-component system cell cycle sensor histidine kinase/response regulator CckA
LDLNAVISETDKLLRRVIGAHIDVRLNLALDAFPIKVDRVQLEQVILNLAVNARDAMPSGGTLSITTRNLSANGANPLDVSALAGPCLMLEVADTGCGMDENTKSHLFEPFFTTKEIGQGTGLGLSTVHGIVKQSGGQIVVESEKDKGATFRIYLPRATVETAAKTAMPVAPATTLNGSETILLAEDNDLALSVAAQALEAFGYKVLKAENPEAAVNLARTYNGSIDLLLTDVIMPRMNGRELAREVCLHRPQIRLLFTSGYTRDVVVHQGVLDAGIELIEKPATPEALALRVRTLLDAEHVPASS